MQSQQPPDRDDGAGPPARRGRARAVAAVDGGGFARPSTRAAPWRIRLAVWAGDVRDWLGRMVALEVDRRTGFNLLPVAFAVGVLAFFAADRAPLWWGPPAALGVVAALAFSARSRPVVHAALVGLAFVLAGLWAAALRTSAVATPQLEATRIGALAGFVESVEPHAGGHRLIIQVTAFAGMEAERRPARVRVTSARGATPGDHVSFTARLTPPPEPARPGGYDFARDAYFRGFGAVGTALGALSLAPAPGPTPWRLAALASVDEARNQMTTRIAAVIGGQAGALAAALVTGKRGLISEETNDILRAAGLYHIVSISGLHMALAAGAIFWLTRALLALSATAARRWPLKKVAAGTAMLGAVAYTIFSGAEVATVRSCLMTLIMLGAVLFDRPALSMRNLALAALVVLAREPETLLGPSFQMSFAAVAALIACAEWLRLRPRAEAPPLGLLGRVWRTLWLAALGLVTTSVLASLATGPFGAYHFQTVNPFGLIGNLLALPFVSLVVMPAAVVGAALYPLGLDAVAWWIMGLATEPVIWVSRNVAAFAGAVTVVPAFSPLALLLVAAGVVVLTVLTTVLRVFGAAPLLAGAVLAAQPTRTDIVIDRNGSGAMVRSATGALTLMGQPSAFVVEQWLRADGDARRPNDPSLRTGTACDSRGCVATTASGRTVAFSRDPSAIAEDCDRATLVVTPLRWRGACKALMVDRGTLDDFGSIAIVDGPGGLSAATSRDPARPKPWHPRPTPRTPSSAMPDAPTLPESHEAPLQ